MAPLAHAARGMAPLANGARVSFINGCELTVIECITHNLSNFYMFTFMESEELFFDLHVV